MKELKLKPDTTHFCAIFKNIFSVQSELRVLHV